MTDLLPMSVLILSCGRTHMLAEAVASALLQPVAEVLVLHDRPEQRVVCHEPRVRVVNAPRYPTLGDKRNAALELAHQPTVTWLDDDDLLAPGYCQALHQALGRTYDAALPQAGWWFDGHAPSPASTPLIAGAFRAEAARRAGFPQTNFGEDAEHRTRVRAAGKVRTLTESVGYVYRWATGAPHVSWSADDGRQRVETDVGKRLQAGFEPRGEVVLRPALGRQWRAWLQDIGRQTHGATRGAGSQ